MKTPDARPRRPALGVGGRMLCSVLGAGALVLFSPATGNATNPPAADSHGCPTNDVCGYSGSHEAGQKDPEPDTPGCHAFKQQEKSVDNNTELVIAVFEKPDCTGQSQSVEPRAAIDGIAVPLVAAFRVSTVRR